MRFIIATVGSHGDVHPFIGLGQALLGRGHRATLIAPALFAPLAERAGVPFVSIGNIQDFRGVMNNADLWHPVRGFKVVTRAVAKLIPDYYHAIHRLAGGGETFLVLSTLAFGGRIAQEHLGIPGVSVHLSPSIFRSAHKPPKLSAIPLGDGQPAWVNRAVFYLMDRLLLDPALAPPINAFRKLLGMALVRDIFGKWMHSPEGVIGLFPEFFAAPQSDWPAHTLLAGFPLYDERDVSAMPDGLAGFLDRSDHGDGRPVAFTPGSGMRHGRRFFDIAVEACGRCGRRGILLSRHDRNLPPRLPGYMIAVDYAPFSLLLPRCAAIVHHGGIGTLSQALASGTPQIIMPMSHDQPDNAQRLERLGVSRTLPPRRFNPANLSCALEELTRSKSVAAACGRVAAEIRGKNSLSDAADIIERVAWERSH